MTRLHRRTAALQWRLAQVLRGWADALHAAARRIEQANATAYTEADRERARENWRRLAEAPPLPRWSIVQRIPYPTAGQRPAPHQDFFVIVDYDQ
jgi:hypothetical protein